LCASIRWREACDARDPQVRGSLRIVARERRQSRSWREDWRKNPEHTLDAIKSIPYGRWREFDAEDTVRFYALRLREAGLIKSSPQKVIAQGTDLRFLNELKRELKV
jgi:NitT/TauT family transport system substrate-binding protein